MQWMESVNLDDSTEYKILIDEIKRRRKKRCYNSNKNCAITKTLEHVVVWSFSL